MSAMVGSRSAKECTYEQNYSTTTNPGDQHSQFGFCFAVTSDPAKLNARPPMDEQEVRFMLDLLDDLNSLLMS